VLAITALGVSRSLLVATALSGDIGIGLWESSRPRFTTDNLIYDGSESGSGSQADLRIQPTRRIDHWLCGSLKMRIDLSFPNPKSKIQNPKWYLSTSSSKTHCPGIDSRYQ
jgi:hypothetical protein